MPDLPSRLSAALADRYRIERELGEGGMATVYLAQDVKHHRKVALKILRPELAAVMGAARFLAEIETTANLHHPHILPLHDSGEADGLLYYVTPYVDGESLRDKLDRERQLPVDEAVRITVALAGALEHAHARGVIHRDIKPANVLLQDGQPVIADFGIALAVGAAGGARLTETGLSLGTPYYMSPEQATGDQAIGPATDVYALACVLYEMLVGEPPFPGSTAQAVLGKIISGSFTSPSQVRPQVPSNVDAALRKALEMLAADRFPTAEAFARALTNPGYRYGPVGPEVPKRRRPWIASAVAAAAVLAAAAAWMVPRTEAPTPVVRYAMKLPDGHETRRAWGSNLALSPDGSLLVYAGPTAGGTEGSQLWLMRRSQLDPTPIPGSEGGYGPSFSPDGSKIAFLVGARPGAGPHRIEVSSLDGEPPTTVAEEDVGGDEVTWGSDGNLYYEWTGGLMRVSAEGGQPERATTTDTARDETFHEWPEMLPGGRGLLFTVTYASPADASKYNLAVADLAAGTHRVLVRGAVFGRYARSGHLVYVTSNGTLMAVPFDPRAMERTGSPVPVAQHVAIGLFGSVDLSLSDDGTLVYRTGSNISGKGRVVWVTRDGAVTPVDPDWSYMPWPEPALALSPDGSRVALFMQTESDADIWVKELDQGRLSKLTFDQAGDYNPRWGPDGENIYFISGRKGQFDVWSRAADGSGVAEMVVDLPTPIFEVEPSRTQQRFLLDVRSAGNTSMDLVSVRRGDTVVSAVAAEPYDEIALDLSDDGRWVAYQANEHGRSEVYVRPFPDPDGTKWLVSTDGGISPRWSHDGRELFYVDGKGTMISARVATTPSFHVLGQRPLFNARDRQLFTGNYAAWDVTPHGQRFVMVQREVVDPDQRQDLVVVENFFRELREKVGR